LNTKANRDNQSPHFEAEPATSNPLRRRLGHSAITSNLRFLLAKAEKSIATRIY
jgi:hypothetical protein